MTTEEQLETATAEWHESGGAVSLREHLRMTPDEYIWWVRYGHVPPSYTAAPVTPAVEGLDDAPQAKEAP